PLLVQEGCPKGGVVAHDQFDSKATTPALRATPPISGGEFSLRPLSLRSLSLLPLIPLLLLAPYIIEEFRYGNAPFFIIALTAAALLYLRQRPILSGSALALAISIKVWPFFFLPYLAVRRNWNVVACTLIFVLLFALLPAFYFGWTGNAR